MTIDGPKAPSRCLLIKQETANSRQDNRITYGIFVRPTQEPTADSNLMSPPPNASGYFFIKKSEAVTGITYPAAAPKALLAADAAGSYPSIPPAKTA